MRYLQAGLRITYTSPKTMHWITKCLIKLYDDSSDFLDFLESIARTAIKNDFFEEHKDDYDRLGVVTPHIVLNYLDYLLWKKDSNKYNDFKFEFRNSVEHWYPQHPQSEGLEIWDDKDRFGNLCIMLRDDNSKFSNQVPVVKKMNYANRVDKGSIKLRIMSEITTTSDSWKDKDCAEHEKEMLDILKKDCEIE